MDAAYTLWVSPPGTKKTSKDKRKKAKGKSQTSRVQSKIGLLGSLPFAFFLITFSFLAGPFPPWLFLLLPFTF